MPLQQSREKYRRDYSGSILHCFFAIAALLHWHAGTLCRVALRRGKNTASVNFAEPGRVEVSRMGRGSCFLLRRARQLQKTLGLAALLSLVLAAYFSAGARRLHAQAKQTPRLNSQAYGGRIHGSAKQGTIPLSGIYVTLVGAASGQKISTL